MAKNRQLKAIFIGPALVLTTLLAFASLIMLALSSADRLGWFGALLASAPMPLLFAQLRFRPVARTSEFLPLHLLLMLVGLTLACRTMYTDFVQSWELYQQFPPAIVAAFNPSTGSAPGLVAIAATVLFLAYLLWYSRLGRYPDTRIDVGSAMPEFEAEDLDGQPVRSTDFLGSPAAYLFYRGNWSALCMAQIDELVERSSSIQELGINVCLISSQPAGHSRRLAEKHGVAFRYLVDKDNRAAEALDIAASNGRPVGIAGDYPADTAMPTLIVASASGTIVFSDQTDNYRVRPEPDIFLAILRRANAVKS